MKKEEFRELVMSLLVKNKGHYANKFKEVLIGDGIVAIRRRVSSPALYCDYIITNEGVFIHSNADGEVRKYEKEFIVSTPRGYVSRVLYLGGKNPMLSFTPTVGNALMLDEELAKAILIEVDGTIEKVADSLDNYELDEDDVSCTIYAL